MPGEADKKAAEARNRGLINASADARGVIREILEGTRARQTAKKRAVAANPHLKKMHTVSLDTCYVQACAARQPRGGAQEKP